MVPYPEMICECINAYKVMYQMKCMDPLHASPTVNLSDPNQSRKMLVVI